MKSDVATDCTRFARAKGDSDGRTLVGRAVPFGEITRIDNWYEGTFDERFRRFAFKRTLQHKTPKLQFNHGTSYLYDEMPLGTFEALTESEGGLDVEARFFKTGQLDWLREAIASGAIDGMSIRFRPIKIEITEAAARDNYDGDVELRTVTEAELIELGPVVFPAYEGTGADMRGLLNKIDGHRLAEALLGGVPLVGDSSNQTHGPGTDSKAGSPATDPDPASRHSDPLPQCRRRTRVARLQQYL